jgi:hypothetical protein
MLKSVSMSVGDHRRARYLVPGIVLAGLLASGAMAVTTAPVAAAAACPAGS